MRKATKKVKIEEPKVEEPKVEETPTPEPMPEVEVPTPAISKEKIILFTSDFGRQDINLLRDKVNEIIDFINKL